MNFSIMIHFFATLIFLFSSVFSPHIAQAEESVAESVINDLASPLTTEAKYFFYAGASVSILLALLEDQISDPLQSEAIEGRPLGDFASDAGVLASYALPNVVYAGSALAYALISGNTKARDRGNLMVRASLFSHGVTTALKYTIREPRPDGSGEKVSFPSGHATNAFSFASVIAMEHAWYWGGLAYSYATLVAYSRMNDNRHLLHDVIGGATIGLSYGIALYLRSHHGEKDQETQKYSFFLLPEEKLAGGKVMASLIF